MEFVSKKIEDLPPYLFSTMHKKKQKLLADGVDIIDLGIGAPDLPPPTFIVEKLKEELQHPNNHVYSPYAGCSEFRKAVAVFYEQQYGVTLDPETEVLALIGSKEGIAHLIPAMTNPGDIVLIPNPGYPVYRHAAYLAGATCINLPLDPDNDYRPNFTKLPNDVYNKAKMMYLNYPGNPTAATVELDVFEEAIAFATKKQIPIIHDSAYSLVTFNDYTAPSILQIPKAKEIAVEVGSLSKSYNMTGWRIGYAVGNKEIIRALTVMKSNIDSSQFIAIQKAAAHALMSDQSTVIDNNHIYYRRMKKMLESLRKVGIKAKEPKGTFFIWAQVPKQYSSTQFTEKLLNDAGVIITPGNAFGTAGEGYFRISLSVPSERLNEAVKRMKSLRWGEKGG